MIECNLDQELKLFVSRHSARFSPDVRGELLDMLEKALFCLFLRTEFINTLGYYMAHFHWLFFTMNTFFRIFNTYLENYIYIFSFLTKQNARNVKLIRPLG